MQTKIHKYVLPLAVMATVLAATAGFLVGRSGENGTSMATDSDIVADTGVGTIWTCSMHPQIRQPEPGQCPICGMNLIPVMPDDGSTELGPRQIYLSDTAEKLAAIQTALVERRFIEQEITAFGEVAHDETRMKYITAWVPGRIDRLYVDFTGLAVRKGDRLADIYSPNLYAAQEEFLQAAITSRELANSKLSSTRETAGLTVSAASEKLRLLGMTEVQIEELRKRGSAGEHITIYSNIDGVVTDRTATTGMYVTTGSHIYTVVDLTTVWVELDVYTAELPWIRLGQEVKFTAESYPGDMFTGSIAFIDPEVDNKIRTVNVRVEVPNPDGKLKPGMFVTATILSALNDDGAAIDVGSGKNHSIAPLVIPRSTPLITGKRAVVYVSVDGQPGVYEGREVELGPRAGNFYIVYEGLTENESVVVNGNFNIDSALQILAKPSMMNPEGGISMTAHNHGSMGGDQEMEMPQGAEENNSVNDNDGMENMDHKGHEMTTPEQEPTKPFDAPDAFLKQLDGVYDAYFAITSALSADSVIDAKAAGKALQENLKKVDMALLGLDAHMAWMDILAVLNEQAGIISESNAIESERHAFVSLSETTIFVVQQFGLSGGRMFYQFHCPMAMDNAGADWLQVESELKNPYFGSSMLTCGSQTTIHHGTE